VKIVRRPVRLAYQPPVSSTFLSKQTSHWQSANSAFLSEQISTSHQSPTKRTLLFLNFWIHTSMTQPVAVQVIPARRDECDRGGEGSLSYESPPRNLRMKNRGKERSPIHVISDFVIAL
jgi:hypothetical protein